MTSISTLKSEGYSVGSADVGLEGFDVTSIGEITRQLYSIAESLPTDLLVAAEARLTEQIARLQAVRDGSSSSDLDGAIASLLAALEGLKVAIPQTINGGNDMTHYAGRL